MKAYVITSGALFALLTLVHLWRLAEEGTELATQPAFVLVTALSTALALWAWRVARQLR